MSFIKHLPRSLAPKMALRAGALRAVLALAIFVMDVPQARARGGMPKEDPWAAAHIEGLPQEIRQSLVPLQQSCGAPLAAQHQFALYLESADKRQKLIALHFENFRCAHRSALCTKEGCLHQVYVSTGGRYRRILNVHVPELELKIVDQKPAAALVCAPSESCQPKILWNGIRINEPIR